MDFSQNKPGIEFVELFFNNLKGQLHCMTIPTDQKKEVKTLEDLKTDKIVKKGGNIDGSSVGLAKVENSDLSLKVDYDRIYELPPIINPNKINLPDFGLQKIRRRVVCLTNIVSRLTGLPNNCDPRNILKEVKQKYLDSQNLVLKVKVEPEFFLYDLKTKKPFDNAGYASVYPAHKGQALLKDISSELRKIGIPIKILHHENGPGQVEIELDYSEISKQADQVIIFKQLTRYLAGIHKMGINYMPKPYSGVCGSGFHVHMRLFEKNKNGELKNLFGCYEKGKEHEVSQLCKHYIAGILKHVPGITAVANSVINSYKRLIPGFEAPTMVAWGYRNRTALVRIPSFKDPKNAACEIRSPDPAANMHLLFALLIGAGMEGIKNKYPTSEPVKANLFEDCDEKIKSLPKNLLEAIEEFKKDELITKILGKECVELYSKVKKEEWDTYLHHIITEQEWDWETEN